MSAATAIYASQEDVNAAAAVLQQLEDEYQQNAPVRDVIAKISAIGEALKAPLQLRRQGRHMML